MKTRFHGIFSICLFLIALIIGGVSIFQVNPVLSLVYFILIPVSFFIVIYSYCTKCPHVGDDSCRHVIFGKVAKLFKQKTGKYTIFELIGTLLPIFCIVAFPQFFLIRTPILMIIFWLLAIIAAIEIMLFVCKGCYNKNCINCPNK
jgi:hypothetical protein